jgi:PAS domain S-box-containing protein
MFQRGLGWSDLLINVDFTILSLAVHYKNAMNKPRILIVEDSPDIIHLLEGWLCTSRFQLVATATSAQEAALLARSANPDLVIMGGVPSGEFDGIQTADTLPEHFDIPVLYLTDTADAEFVEQTRAGFLGTCLARPFSERELITALEVALVRHDLLRRLKTSEARLAAVQDTAENDRKLLDLTERRSAERSSGRFRIALDSSPDAIFLIDPASMRFLDFNQTACDSLGYTRSELLELGPHDIKPQYNRTTLHERFVNVLAGKPGADMIQTVHQRKDGSSFSVEVRLRPFESEGRSLMAVVARDVSARLFAETQLREANERFLQLAENVSDVFWIRDLEEDRFLYVSPAFEALFRKPVSSVYQRPRSFLSGVHPDDRDRVAAVFEWQRQHRQGVDLEYRIIVGDNEIRWLWVRTFPVQDLLGKVYRMAGIIEDVTHRRESEEQYRTIIQASIDGFWVADVQGRIVDCNDAYCRTLGYTREEVLGLPISELDHNESAEHIHLVIEHGNDRFETRHRHKNGQLIDMEVSAYYQPDAKGGRLYAFLRDISKRKRAADALRESELRYRSLIADLPGIAYRCALDADWTVEIFCGEVERLTGYPPSDFLDRHRTYASIIHPDDTARVEQVVMDGVSKRSRFEIEYRICHADGRILTVHENGHGVCDDAGKLLWLDGFIWDVTERKRSEQALIESEERYRAVVEDQTELISRFRVDGTFTFVNDVFCRFFGRPAEELVGHAWHPVVFPEDLPMIETKLGSLSPSNPVVLIENRVFSGSGELHWMQFVNRAFFDGEGRITEIQSVGRDISVQKGAERALREAENFKRAILDAVSTQVAVLDRSGTIIEVNDAWRRFAIENSSVEGQAAAHTGIGTSYLGVCLAAQGMSSEGAQEVAQGIRAMLNGSVDVFTYEYSCHAPHKQRWFQMTVTPLGSAQGGVVVSHSDITAPRILAEELRKSEARTRSILRAAPVGIGMLVDRVFQEVNQAMTTLTGYTADELLGRSARMLYPTQADFDHVGQEKYRQIWEHGVGSVETRWRRKDGTVIDVSLSSSPIVANDLAQGVTFTAQDITSTKQAERERLTHEASQRDALVREVHHRIKNNLQGVIGLLRQYIAVNPDIQPPIEAAIAQVNTVAVVHGLQSRMPQSELRMRELLHEVNGAAAALAMVPHPPSIEDTLPGDVWLDSSAAVSIALILNELLQNALKHGRYDDGTGVEISLSGNGQRVTLRIRNPGECLPDHFDLITGTGCGTGLDLVRTLLPRHGAELDLHVRDGYVETEFVLTSPVIAARDPVDRRD